MANCYQNIISNLLEIVSMINDNVQLNGRSEVNKMLSMFKIISIMCELNIPQNTGHFHFILLLGVVDYQCYGASRYQAASLYPSHTYI